MKELPYFKFYPAEWMKGDVTDCSLEAQGLFINICVLYWMKGGELNLTRVQRKFNGCLTPVQELLDDGIIDVKNDEICISFLDEQFSQFNEWIEQKRRAGKASAEKRKFNDRSTTVQRPINDKEKKREDKNKKRVFIPPTLDEVKIYCKERKNNVNPSKWMSHYESNGWMVGKNKMKDWKAAVRTWENNEFNKSEQPVIDRARTEGVKEDYFKPLPKGVPMPDSMRKKYLKIGKE